MRSTTAFCADSARVAFDPSVGTVARTLTEVAAWAVAIAMIEVGLMLAAFTLGALAAMARRRGDESATRIGWRWAKGAMVGAPFAVGFVAAALPFGLLMRVPFLFRFGTRELYSVESWYMKLWKPVFAELGVFTSASRKTKGPEGSTQHAQPTS